jgi:hypothetical protein
VEIYVLLNFFYILLCIYLLAYVNLRIIIDDKEYPLPLNGL